MSGLAQWLLAMAGPLVMRVLLSLGLSVVTFVGVKEAANGLVSNVQSLYGGLPADVAALAGLAGVGEGLGIVLGAIAGRVALWALASSTRMIFK